MGRRVFDARKRLRVPLEFGDVTTSKYVILGVCEERSRDVSIMALHRYSVLKVSTKERATKN
jgi:hypothetical protein